MKRGMTWFVVGMLAMAGCGDVLAAGDPPADQPGQLQFLGGFLRETVIQYPERLGEWSAGETHRYEEVGGGISIHYRHDALPGMRLDVYFYPAGVLDEDEFAATARRTLEDVRQARESNGERVESSGLDAFLPTGDAKVPGYIADLRIEGGQRAFSSVLSLSLDRLYFVKGRLSMAESEMTRTQARGVLEEFVGALQRTVVIGSSGECQLALESLKADLAGCDGKQLQSRELPEGMQEIRMEYPPPARQPVPRRIQRG